MKANEVRKGVVIMHNGAPHRIMDFHHHTPGNLRAMVQTKMRNLLSGNQTEVRFSSTEDLTEADVNTASATYLYSDHSGYHFMYKESYEEITISEEVLSDGKFYLQDQMDVNITTYEGAPIGVDLPSTVVLTIADTTPEIRGATASNSPKPAKTDTGLMISVPPFIAIGERVIVNTTEGKYMGRAD
jgi:elongation factor P